MSEGPRRLALVVGVSALLLGIVSPGIATASTPIDPAVATAIGAPGVALPEFVDSPESQNVGTVSVVAPPEAAPVKNNPGVWILVPGLATSVYSRGGDNLEITVTAEMIANGTVWFRSLVDGSAAQPTDVHFKMGSANFDGTRSFTFVQSAVAAGEHIVEIQWYTPFGASAQVRDRTLNVNSASPTAGAGRLAVAAGISGPDRIKTTSAWATIPGLITTLTTTETTTLAVVLSAEADADSGRFFARALVDSAVVSDVLFAEAGNGGRQGSRSYTFVLRNLAAGRHVVALQWSAQGGKSRIGDRTLAAFAAPESTTGGGQFAYGAQQAPTKFTSSGWTTIPGMTRKFTTTAPSSSATLTFGGEVQISSNRMFLRAQVDGRSVAPGDVTLIQGGSKWRASTFSFTVKNLRPGFHEFRFQAAVDAGSSGYIGDRFMRVVFKDRSGAEFSQYYRELGPKVKTFNSLVLCFDPLRPDVPAPSHASLVNMLEGADGRLNVRSWFNENSAGHVQAGSFQYVGCDDGNWFLPPPDRRGNWYWDNKRFDLMWQDAIKAADPVVNFHAYDLNRDNKLSPDELTLILVRPQNGPFGTNRTVNVAVDGKSPALNFWVVDVYVSASDSQRRGNVGLISHELSHASVDAWDLHTCPSATAAGAYSIMDATYTATDFDPFHKLHYGFVQAQPVTLNPLRDSTLQLGAVETRHEVAVLYDPGRNDREYFIVENRWQGTESSPTYDAVLTGGVVVWLVIQDQDYAQAFPPPGGEACPAGRNSVRKLGILTKPGTALDLRWTDGTNAHVRVTADHLNEEVSTVMISNLP